MATIKKKDLQIEIKSFEEFARDFKYEILVSYDCAGIHKPFREELKVFLESMYGVDFINESFYKLKEKLSKEGIATLKERIEKLFKETVLKESIKHDNITTINIIFPSIGKFNYERIEKSPK